MKDHIKDTGECSRGTQSAGHSVDLTRLLHQKSELNKENDQLDRKSGEICFDTFEEEIDKHTRDYSTKLDERKDINSIEDINLIKDLLKKSCDSIEIDKLESDSGYLCSLMRRKEKKISSIESDKSFLKKEMYICNQERSIIIEARMLCSDWQKHGEPNQSGQETHYEEDLLRQLGDLGREFQLLKEHREVLRERSAVLQELDDIERKLRHPDLSSEEREGWQKTVQNLQWRIKTLENRSKTLSEVMQKWWEMLQTADKIKHVLNKVDQSNENTDLDDHREFLKKCSIQLGYHEFFLRNSDYQIPEELRYSEELYDKEKVLLDSSLYEELEKCFAWQERRLDDLVRYVMFLQKGSDCLIEMYDHYKADMSIGEPTGLERSLELLNKYSQVVDTLTDRRYEVAEDYKAEEEYKYRKTSYDLMLICGDALQDLLGNHNKLKRPDLLPEERECLEIQNSICEKACKIGEKQQQILQDELKRPEPYCWSDEQETLFKIATIHLDYLKELWQQKSAMSSAFAENPQNIQTVIQQYRDWEKASQEREKCLDALGKFHEMPDKRIQHVTKLLHGDHPKRDLLHLLKDNLEYLADDCCKSDNVEHLQKVKSSRVKLIEAADSDLDSSKNLAELRKDRDTLKKLSEKLRELDKMDPSSQDYRETLRSIEMLEKSYYNWEKGTPSTSSNTNRLELFKWKGFR